MIVYADAACWAVVKIDSHVYRCMFCREIGRMDTKDLSRDSSGTRAYASFLLELARCVPAVMLPSISVLLVLLDGEVSV